MAFFSFISILTQTAQAQSGGKASYYSNGLHGRRMSNGERYDRNGFTCAHRTLPFGTRLRVTNPRNGRSVIVRVTDRGPFVRGRVVDLSYAAARELGTLSCGVAYVKVEVVPKETEIPFPSESTGGIEMPEVEYGTAGVCYEFIPEWEKPEEDRPKEIERKVNTRLNNRRLPVQTKVERDGKDNTPETRSGLQSSKAKTQAVASRGAQAAQQNRQGKQNTQPVSPKKVQAAAGPVFSSVSKTVWQDCLNNMQLSLPYFLISCRHFSLQIGSGRVGLSFSMEYSTTDVE